ncbi:Uncharacterised protein [Klebsiella pneumoniae]|uniref:Uncharacterized protein n=1 Tax=Klebsiella pneumoniae TaxID=573 RepID=A0A2X3EUY7_KLEPN|nr:Uncharacterised protein [Klebsiella pneumoniae]
MKKIWRCAPMFALESMNMARRCGSVLTRIEQEG